MYQLFQEVKRRSEVETILMQQSPIVTETTSHFDYSTPGVPQIAGPAYSSTQPEWFPNPTITKPQSNLLYDNPSEILFQNTNNTQEMHSTDLETPWFDRTQYTRINDGGVIRYVHRTAGRVVRKGTTQRDDLLASRAKENLHTPWYPFSKERQWKLGYWLLTCKSSQSKIDEFLDMEDVGTCHA